MSEGLTLSRIGNVSKYHTSFNVSQDFKEELKVILESEIAKMTKDIERQVLEKEPGSKSLLSLERPQLSYHRVKEIMEQNTDLTVSSEVAIFVKDKMERKITELTKFAENNAREEGLTTLKKRHLPSAGMPDGTNETQAAATSDGSSPDLCIPASYLFKDNIKSLCREYTPLKLDEEALDDIKFRMEDHIEMERLNIENAFTKKQTKEILEGYNRVSGVLSQVRLKKVLGIAGQLAVERNRKTISIEDISDSFSRIDQG
jgi:histone H3/H4